MVALLPSPFVFILLQQRRQRHQNKEKKKTNGNNNFCFLFFLFFCCSAKSPSSFVLLRFHCSEEEKDDNFCHFLRWLCCKKLATCAFFRWLCSKEGDNNNVVAFLYGVGDVKKAMVNGDFSFFCCWSLRFSSLVTRSQVLS